MDEKATEPLTKWPFLSGLPTDVASGLKSATGVVKLDVGSIVTHAKIVLHARNGGCRLK